MIYPLIYGHTLKRRDFEKALFYIDNSNIITAATREITDAAFNDNDYFIELGKSKFYSTCSLRKIMQALNSKPTITNSNPPAFPDNRELMIRCKFSNCVETIGIFKFPKELQQNPKAITVAQLKKNLIENDCTQYSMGPSQENFDPIPNITEYAVFINQQKISDDTMLEQIHNKFDLYQFAPYRAGLAIEFRPKSQ